MMWRTFIILSTLSATSLSTVLASSCSCTSGFLPIPINVSIPRDPSNPQGLNTTDTIQLGKTFNIFGELCQPVTATKFEDHLQVLIHGQTYTHAYWDINWNGYQNYSYVSFSCQNGITSFAYDNVCAGLSTKPQSEECQLPSAAEVASLIARDAKSGKLAQTLTGHAKKFAKVIGFGHSLGSVTLNYAAIRDGYSSPFDGLVLTGHIHDLAFLNHLPVNAIANQDDPARFGNLDSGYITANATARLNYYGPMNTFSPVVFQLDVLTRDIGSMWLTRQGPFVYVPAVGFTGPVVEMVGQFDKLHCIPDGGPCIQSTLQKSEPPFFPQSKNVTTIVIPGTGHDLNTEFSASLSFRIMNDLFALFVS